MFELLQLLLQLGVVRRHVGIAGGKTWLDLQLPVFLRVANFHGLGRMENVASGGDHEFEMVQDEAGVGVVIVARWEARQHHLFMTWTEYQEQEQDQASYCCPRPSKCLYSKPRIEADRRQSRYCRLNGYWLFGCQVSSSPPHTHNTSSHLRILHNIFDLLVLYMYIYLYPSRPGSGMKAILSSTKD